MPIINVSAIRTIFYDPSWVSFSPFSHFILINILLRYRPIDYQLIYTQQPCVAANVLVISGSNPGNDRAPSVIRRFQNN